MSKIFINIFIHEPSEYVNELKGLLQNKETLEDLEYFLETICTKYKKDIHGTTTWVNDHVIIRSGYFSQFSVPLSASVKENKYGNTADQLACWEGFNRICEVVKSGEYV